MRLLNLFGVSLLAQLLVYVHGAGGIFRQRRPLAVTLHIRHMMSGDVIHDPLDLTDRNMRALTTATTVAELRQQVLELAPLPRDDQTYDLIFIPPGERPSPTPCPILLENDGSTLADYGIMGGDGKINFIFIVIGAERIGGGAERRQWLERWVCGLWSG